MHLHWLSLFYSSKCRIIKGWRCGRLKYLKMCLITNSGHLRRAVRIILLTYANILFFLVVNLRAHMVSMIFTDAFNFIRQDMNVYVFFLFSWFDIIFCTQSLFNVVAPVRTIICMINICFQTLVTGAAFIGITTLGMSLVFTRLTFSFRRWHGLFVI